MLVYPLRGHIIGRANLQQTQLIIILLMTTMLVGNKLTNEWAAVVLLEKNLPSPRSPSFTTPSAVIKTLAGLMSLKPLTMASKTSNAF